MYTISFSNDGYITVLNNSGKIVKIKEMFSGVSKSYAEIVDAASETISDLLSYELISEEITAVIDVSNAHKQGMIVAILSLFRIKYQIIGRISWQIPTLKDEAGKNIDQKCIRLANILYPDLKANYTTRAFIKISKSVLLADFGRRKYLQNAA